MEAKTNKNHPPTHTFTYRETKSQTLTHTQPICIYDNNIMYEYGRVTRAHPVYEIHLIHMFLPQWAWTSCNSILMCILDWILCSPVNDNSDISMQLFRFRLPIDPPPAIGRVPVVDVAVCDVTQSVSIAFDVLRLNWPKKLSICTSNAFGVLLIIIIDLTNDTLH